MSFSPKDSNLARQSALRLLARRDHCKGELVLKLIRNGFDRGTATAVVVDLEHERLVDDARFVEHFVTYQADDGHGSARIRKKLGSASLELDPALIERFVDHGQDWVARARAVREKKFGRAMPETHVDKIKQAYFLQYRGFATEHIRLALGTDIDIVEDGRIDDDS